MSLVRSHPLLVLFATALVVRTLAYFAFNFLVFDGGFIHPDSQMYHDRSVQVAESWASGKPDLVRYPAYVNPVGLLYFIFGHHRFLPEMVNLVVGSLLPVMVFVLGRQVFSNRSGYIAGSLVVIDPLLIYESTQFLRDILITASVLGILIGAVYWKERIWTSWTVGLLSLFSVCFLLNRPTVGAAIVLGFVFTTGVSLVLKRQTFPHWAYTIPTIVLVWSSFFLQAPGTVVSAAPPTSGGTGAQSTTEVGMLDRINSYGERLESPQFSNEFFNELNTGIGPFAGYVQFILYTPIAGLKALFYPLPWLANSGFELMFGTYMLWWYGLVVLGLLGLLVSSWTWTKFLSLVLVVILLVGLGLGGPVMSGLIRWRLPITMLMIIWASQFLVWAWDVWRGKCIRGHLTWVS